MTARVAQDVGVSYYECRRPREENISCRATARWVQEEGIIGNIGSCADGASGHETCPAGAIRSGTCINRRSLDGSAKGVHGA